MAQDNPTLARLRERIAERLAYAELKRTGANPFAPMQHADTDTREWSRGYWTGAADAYNLALTALDVLSATEVQS